MGPDPKFHSWGGKESPELPRDPWFIKILPDWAIDYPWLSFIGLLGLSASLPILFGRRPASIERYLPPWVQIMWAVALLCGCALLLTGLVMDKPLVERLGLQIFGPASIVYGGVVLFAAGWSGVTAFFPYCLFSLVSYIEAYKIRRSLLIQSRAADGLSGEQGG